MEQSLVERILKIKNTNEKEILLNLISQEKEKFKQLTSEDDFIRQAILDFVIIYNPLNFEWKNETVANFCKKLIQFYDEGNNISIPILNLMNDYFKDPSYFNVLIHFEKKIKKEKAYLECCFKLILLTKNLENLLNGIKNYLKINNEFLFKQIEKIDFDSPYEGKFFEEQNFGVLLN